MNSLFIRYTKSFSRRILNCKFYKKCAYDTLAFFLCKGMGYIIFWVPDIVHLSFKEITIYEMYT
jgi:hypothetical protein